MLENAPAKAAPKPGRLRPRPPRPGGAKPAGRKTAGRAGALKPATRKAAGGAKTCRRRSGSAPTSCGSSDGRPEGRDHAHWQQAEREIGAAQRRRTDARLIGEATRRRPGRSTVRTAGARPAVASCGGLPRRISARLDTSLWPNLLCSRFAPGGCSLSGRGAQAGRREPMADARTRRRSSRISTPVLRRLRGDAGLARDERDGKLGRQVLGRRAGVQVGIELVAGVIGGGADRLCPRQLARQLADRLSGDVLPRRRRRDVECLPAHPPLERGAGGTIKDR